MCVCVCVCVLVSSCLTLNSCQFQTFIFLSSHSLCPHFLHLLVQVSSDRWGKMCISACNKEESPIRLIYESDWYNKSVQRSLHIYKWNEIILFLKSWCNIGFWINYAFFIQLHTKNFEPSKWTKNITSIKNHWI